MALKISSRLVALLAAIALAVAALLVSSTHWTTGEWLEFVTRINIAAIPFVLYCAPILLFAASLIAWKNAARLAMVVAAFGVAYGAIVAINSGQRFGVYYSTYGPRFMRILELPSIALAVIAVALLLVQRLRGTLDRARIAACALVILLLGLHIAASIPEVLPYTLPVEAACAVLNIASFIFLAFVAWCLAFRQAAPHRPPVDAGRTVALTCPRCHTPQQIPAGHGECSSCRLQITISLNEGVCARCNYPLRGLTGDKCPECGTPIVAASALSAAQQPA
jgi:hypothetical protein